MNESTANNGFIGGAVTARMARAATHPEHALAQARYNWRCWGPLPEREDELRQLVRYFNAVEAFAQRGGRIIRWVLAPAIAYLRREVEAFPRPVLRWAEQTTNIVTTQGLNDNLDKYLGGSSYTAAWYLLLVSSVSFTGFALGDTAAQINGSNGWKEAGPTNAPNYSAGTRPAVSWSAAAAGVKASSATVNYTFTASGTVKGGGLVSNNTKDGTGGVLFSVSAFTEGDKAVANTEQLQVTVTVTLANP